MQSASSQKLARELGVTEDQEGDVCMLTPGMKFGSDIFN